MPVANVIFWVCCAALFYCYIGYGLLLRLVAPFRHQTIINNRPTELPGLTLVVPCFNEGEILHQKIKNSLALNYPPHLFNVLFVADGSVDDSLAILAQYPQVKTIFNPQRKGKAAALNRAMQQVRTPIVIFSDANSLLNEDCLLEIVNCFTHDKVGGVAGEKRIAAVDTGVGDVEGLYWRYESWLKKSEAKFYSVIGAAGELFALRTRLYQPLPEHIILDDLFISLEVCLQGFTINYAAKACATEAPSASLAEEEKRKVRIAAGAFQVLGHLSMRQLLARPVIAFQFFSRRWLRWVVCPLSIIVVLVMNLLLVIEGASFFYTVFLGLQLLFYAMAFTGWAFIKRNNMLTIVSAAFYFLFMNYCLLKGLLLFLRNRQTVLWPKAARQS